MTSIYDNGFYFGRLSIVLGYKMVLQTQANEQYNKKRSCFAVHGLLLYLFEV
jgi:hypothetical protein